MKFIIFIATNNQTNATYVDVYNTKYNFKEELILKKIKKLIRQDDDSWLIRDIKATGLEHFTISHYSTTDSEAEMDEILTEAITLSGAKDNESCTDSEFDNFYKKQKLKKKRHEIYIKYYDKHKKEIKNKGKEVITCEYCNIELTKASLSRHNKGINHKRNEMKRKRSESTENSESENSS
jgi:hypothetical protein